MTSRILITGASGYVGRALCHRLGSERVIKLFATNPMEGGIHYDARSMAIANVLGEQDGVSHCVIGHAIIDIERCAAEPEFARRINVDSTIEVINWCFENNIKPIFLSSEAVFSRDEPPPANEEDAPNPYAEYGRMKLEVERYLQGSGGDYLIIRLSRVMGTDRGDRTGFENWFEAIEGGLPITCAIDQIISPIRVTDAAEGLTLAIEENLSGLYHLAGPSPISRIEFLKLLIETHPKATEGKFEIKECQLSDFPVRDKRPLNSSLDPGKFIRDTGLELPTYRQWCRDLV